MKKKYPHKNNILLVNITRLGDMLQATPTIAGMKEENPESKVTVLVEKQFDEVCRIIPGIDEVVSIDLAMTVRSLAREGEGIIDAYEYVDQLVNELRNKNFDYCLNMSSSAYTALLLNLIGIKRNGGWTADEEGYRVIESEWARLFATSVFHQNRQFNSLNLVDVFRSSADVEKHPQKLLLDIDQQNLEFAQGIIDNCKFNGDGPLIALQAGASQEKRQWGIERFAKLGKILVNEYKARLLLIGTEKERSFIEKIKEQAGSDNIQIAAGKTSIPQLAALLHKCKLLITGDTGPMHISVAAGTPVLSMFLASAYGFETGPYSAGNIVLQPVIQCGPCNPNKPCSRPDCHDHISPELIAKLSMNMISGEIHQLDSDLIDPSKLIAYKSVFDKYGYCDLLPISSDQYDPLRKHRIAYRKMWLDDIGGFVEQDTTQKKPDRFNIIQDQDLAGLKEVISLASDGKKLISQLTDYIKDCRAPGSSLAKVNDSITELDRKIEQVGFYYNYLGPLTRMFVFAKENLSGSDPLVLASQMNEVYEDLHRRSNKFARYYMI